MIQSFVLKRGDMVALIRGTGSRIEVTQGEVWMTQLGDANDYLIRDGAREVESDAPVLIHALDGCRVALTVPPAAQLHLRRHGQEPVAIVQLPAARPLAAARSWFAFA